jgi:carotenoid cleavage dioxygenase-like enzyme
MKSVALATLAIVVLAAIEPPCEKIFDGPDVFAVFAGAFCNAPERTDVVLNVTFGNVPSWFVGTLYRNVPSQYSVGPDQVQHWFDGLAQINAIDFGKDGNVTLRSRFLNNTAFHNMNDVDHRYSYTGAYTFPFPGAVFPGNTTAPPHGPARKGSMANNDVSILAFGGRTFATSDVSNFVEFDPRTLRTITPEGMVFNDTLNDHPGPSLGVTHGVVDYRKGEFINYAQNLADAIFGGNTTTTFFRVTEKAAAEEKQWHRDVIGSISTPQANYAHSLGATDKYIVLIENPVVDNALADALGLPAIRNLIDESNTSASRVHLVDRRTGEHRIATVPEHIGLLLHTGNVYEDKDGSVVYDASAFDDATVYDALAFDALLGPDFVANQARLRSGRFVRCRIFPRAATTDATCSPIETMAPNSFPWFNKNFYMRPYRYAYTTMVWGGEATGGHIRKIDVTTNQTVGTWAGPNGSTYLLTEALFVPKKIEVPPPDKPDPATEEDGLLVSVMYDVTADRSVIAGVDPVTMTTVFLVTLPFTIPPHFHGTFCEAPTQSGDKIGNCLWN